MQFDYDCSDHYIILAPARPEHAKYKCDVTTNCSFKIVEANTGLRPEFPVHVLYNIAQVSITIAYHVETELNLIILTGHGFDMLSCMHEMQLFVLCKEE